MMPKNIRMESKTSFIETAKFTSSQINNLVMNDPGIKMAAYLQKQKVIALFLILALATIAIDFLTQHFILTRKVYYNTFSEQLSMDQIDKVLTTQNESLFLIYPIDIAILFVKCLLMTLIIQAGLYFKKIEIDYNNLLKIIITAEFVFLLPVIIKFLWFYNSIQNYTIDELKTFSPLSALAFFDEKTLPLLWFYPLKILNVFEILYWFVLGFFISKTISKRFDFSLNVVVVSYLPVLLIWVSFIMFLVVTLNPS